MLLKQIKDFLVKWIKNLREEKFICSIFLNPLRVLNHFIHRGAFYLYISCKGFINQKDKNNLTISNDLDFAEYLLNNAKVAIVPGIAFGKSPFFRLSYATSFDELKEACERIKFCLKNFDIKLMKILIYGVGGVGGFIGSFFKKTEYEIFYVARGKRYEFLKKEGLILNSQIENLKFKKINIISKFKEGDHFDIIIITVKLYDLDNVF